jgi:aminoglycoside phosphotransferase (APT) family kinase protein
VPSIRPSSIHMPAVDDAVRHWLAKVLGAREVKEIRSLTFGVASDLRLLGVDGDPFVLRRYMDDTLSHQSPELISDEVTTLRAARRVLGALVPEPIAFDPTGALAGHPALLMTYLPGTVVVHDLDPHRLAESLAALHASVVPVEFPRYHQWFEPTQIAVPGWTRVPKAWATLLAHLGTPEPESPIVFLHRDFHPGNLLWQNGELVGIVDWASACRGPRAVDVAHTRANLALVNGAPAADRFLDAYGTLVPSHRHDPWWDAAELFSFASDFSGVLAFNAFGAELSEQLVRSRADDYAGTIASSVSP